MHCTSVTGDISSTSIGEILNIVRARVLELTMKLDKEVPGSSEISIGHDLEKDSGTAKKVEQVVNMTVHGPNTMITSTGSQTEIAINNVQGDLKSFENELISAGVPDSAAKEFSQIISNEKPEGPDTTFGNKASEWLGKAMPEIAKGTWGIGISVATRVLEEAAKKYYGG
jgi:hypothetical protein